MIKSDEDDEFDRIERENSMKGQPYIYQSKREWINLTDEEILNIYNKCNMWEMFVYERTIEAKIKELNS